jgi:hypothetical protein
MEIRQKEDAGSSGFAIRRSFATQYVIRSQDARTEKCSYYFMILMTILGREQVKLKLTSQDPDTLNFVADHSTINNSEKHAKVSDTCLFLDLTGIAASMAASYIAGIHYAFFCYPWWRNFYLITVGIYYLNLLCKTLEADSSSCIPNNQYCIIGHRGGKNVLREMFRKKAKQM